MEIDRPIMGKMRGMVSGSERSRDHLDNMRREFHSMRYQLVDEASQLSFVDVEHSPVFEALSIVETSELHRAPVTAGALNQLEGTETHSMLVEAVERMSVGFILFDAEDRLILCNKKYKELYSHLAPLLVRGTSYNDIADAAFAHSGHGLRLDGWVRHEGAGDSDSQRIGLPEGSWVETQDEELSDGSRLSVRTDVTEAHERELGLSGEADALHSKLDRAHTLAQEIDGLFLAVCRDSAVLENQVSEIGGLRAICQVIEHSAVRGRGLASRLIEGIGSDAADAPTAPAAIPKMPRLKVPAAATAADLQGAARTAAGIVTVRSDGTLKASGITYRCALGASGVTASKREGDTSTPMGCFAIREVLYRPDREEAPDTTMPVAPLGPSSAWCIDPTDEEYNQPVSLPYDGASESLWREDGIYDIVVVLGYNDRPIIPGCGSAIFLHVADDDYGATKGGISQSREDLLRLLKSCKADTRICIVG